MTTKVIGEEGFRWFLGLVEDRNDPEKLGRVKVRVHNVHGNTVEAPTTDLPWAVVLMPGYSASLNRVGVSATGLQVGSTVVGFFLDGNNTTMPVVFGVLPAKDDMSLLAMEQQSIQKTQTGPEPASAYRSKYPFNKVFQSESGHVIEIDDTPNFERTHTYHKSGTYTEINQEGRRVEKIVGDDFEIVIKNKTIYIQGNVNMKVDGNVNVKVGGTYTVESGGNMKFTAPRIDLN